MKFANNIALLILLCSGCGESSNSSSRWSDKPLPVIGQEIKETIVNGRRQIDTIDHTVNDIPMVNQHGDTVTQKMMAGEAFIVTIFNTTCQSKEQPLLEHALKRVQDIYIDEPKLYFLSLTVDPEGDLPAKLLDYSKHHTISSRHYFLTGIPTDSMHHLIRHSYLMQTGIDSDKPYCGFIHGTYAALVDENRRIRGMYRMLDSNETEDLIHDIRILIKEDEN